MRSCGILMPIFSLPSRYGIGNFGKEAYNFVDFLYKAGQSYWQILPLNPTNYGDSPYQSFSSYAGNPYFIDPDTLIDEGLLTKKEAESFEFFVDADKVDYGKLYENRAKLLKLAHNRFSKTDQYRDYIKKNAFWLNDYALFMSIKNEFNDASWTEWPKPLRVRDKAVLNEKRQALADGIDFYCFIQYQFDKQWKALKSYANEKGIKIIGDIPIYVALDSADVWAEPQQFLLDNNLKPKKVAGCPPDAFSEDGQLWGNPLYNWKIMKEDGYSWWKKRMGYALELYDLIRIDHFRGFESFYAIPFGDRDAKGGRWMKGPNIDLFRALENEFGKDLPIIAEDLGFLTPAVLKMLKESGFPGMKVLQFAFDDREENDYLPHNFGKNCVVYTGTHDNDTILGWTKSASVASVDQAYRYTGFSGSEGFNWTLMRLALMSVADTCILMMPDLISLGTEGRINTPSTLGCNWTWRMGVGLANDWLAKLVYDNVCLYGRLPEK